MGRRRRDVTRLPESIKPDASDAPSTQTASDLPVGFIASSTHDPVGESFLSDNHDVIDVVGPHNFGKSGPPGGITKGKRRGTVQTTENMQYILSIHTERRQ